MARQARTSSPQARSGAARAARPQTRVTAVLGLQRSAGNRAVRSLLSTGGAAILARDPLAIDDEQLRREAGTRGAFQSVAGACLTMLAAYRGGAVRQLLTNMIAFYAPDSTREVSAVEYRADAAGITVTDVGKSGGKVVIGDDALARIRRGAVDQVGQEVRGAVGQLAGVAFTARRPAIIWIGGERVRVSSADEAKDAERIMKLLKDSYGVTFDSVAARRDVRKEKAERGWTDDKQRALDVTPWTYMDLKDLEAGFKYFAPILGKARTKSARASSPQEVVRLGRIKSPVEQEGQYLPDSHTIATYTSHPDVIADPDEQTIVHEIAHAVFGPLLEDFRIKIGYWTHPRDGKFEAPPTPYGNKNPDEDLAESVALYFTAPDLLKDGSRGKKRGQVANACPQRFRWIAAEVKQWTPARR